MVISLYLHPPYPSSRQQTSVRRVLRTLRETLVQHGARLVVTQLDDLVDETCFVQSSFLNPEVPMTRVGVLEEDLPTLRSALDEFMSHQTPVNVTRKDVEIENPPWRKNDTDDGEEVKERK